MAATSRVRCDGVSDSSSSAAARSDRAFISRTSRCPAAVNRAFRTLWLLGSLPQSDQTAFLERLDQPRDVAGIEPQSTAQIPEVRSLRADLV